MIRKAPRALSHGPDLSPAPARVGADYVMPVPQCEPGAWDTLMIGLGYIALIAISGVVLFGNIQFHGHNLYTGLLRR